MLAQLRADHRGLGGAYHERSRHRALCHSFGTGSCEPLPGLPGR